MREGFWLSDEAWAAIEPSLPHNRPGARRVDDRRVISGIVHLLKSGCRWQDVPAAYGPPTTIYNLFNRWSHRGIWQRVFATLVAAAEIPEDLTLDSTHVKAHRSAAGGKGGQKFKPSGDRVAVQRPRSTPCPTPKAAPMCWC